MDVGTSFGGIGSSREVMIASLAEPAMLHDRVHAGAGRRLDPALDHRRVHGSTQASACASRSAWRWSRLIIVAIAENARIPVDNPATHLELTMVHEAMVLEYSGRHLALIELAAVAQAAALYLADRLHLRALGPGAGRQRAGRRSAIGLAAYLGKLAVARLPARPVRDVDRQDARLPRAGVPRRRLMLGLLATLLLFVSRSF